MLRRHKFKFIVIPLPDECPEADAAKALAEVEELYFARNAYLSISKSQPRACQASRRAVVLSAPTGGRRLLAPGLTHDLDCLRRVANPVTGEDAERYVLRADVGPHGVPVGDPRRSVINVETTDLLLGNGVRDRPVVPVALRLNVSALHCRLKTHRPIQRNLVRRKRDAHRRRVSRFRHRNKSRRVEANHTPPTPLSRQQDSRLSSPSSTRHNRAGVEEEPQIETQRTRLTRTGCPPLPARHEGPPHHAGGGSPLALVHGTKSDALPHEARTTRSGEEAPSSSMKVLLGPEPQQ
jgi:hypothetical protein